MGKKKKPKIEVELTSLDEWIAVQEELHKNDPKPEKTPEQIKEEEAEKVKFAKFNKKQKTSYLLTKANEYRDQMAVKYAAWKKIEAERKERLRIELENREVLEFSQIPTRTEQLKETMNKINIMEKTAWDFESQDVRINEWNLYVTCFPLPYPEHAQDMNAYIEYWKQTDIAEWTLDEAIQRSEAVMYFLNALDHHILKPLNATKNQIREWRLIVQDLKLMLQKNINYGTYYILRDIHNRMKLSEDVRIATFNKDTKFFSIALWTKLKVPIPLPDPYETTPPSLSVKFDTPKSNFHFPLDINLTNVAIRILQLEYDHQSWLSKSYADPDCADVFEDNFFVYIEKQWTQKQHIKYSRRIKKPIIIDPNVEEQPEPEPEPELDENEIITQRWTYDRDIVPVPSDLMDKFATEICSNELQKYKIVETGRIFNLRRYLIVGNTTHINLIIVPPQPRRLMMDVKETAFEIPRKLIELPYYVPSPVLINTKSSMSLQHKTKKTAKPDISTGLLDESYRILLEQYKERDEYKSLTALASKAQLKAEELEEEEEETNFDRKSSETILNEVKQTCLNRMVHVVMDIPQNVYWIDKPTLCYWDANQSNWTTDNIYECEIDADFKQVSFRIGQFGIFGFVVNRHYCFPFKWWDMAAISDEQIVFNLETNLFSFKISMKSNKFCLEEINGIEEKQTKTWGILGSYFHLHVLADKLRHRGIDIFPSFDTFNYIEESTQKHWILERHVYYCMALVSFGYEFQPSKWNIKAGLRKIFFQLREIEGNKLKIVYVDEWKSFLVQTTEEDWELDMTPIKGIPFAGDFYQVYNVSANCTTKRHVNATPYETAYAVFELLCAFRPLSFTYFDVPDMEEEEEEEESIETVTVTTKTKKSGK